MGQQFGQNISNDQAQTIMSQTGGGDPGQVQSYFSGGSSSLPTSTSSTQTAPAAGGDILSQINSIIQQYSGGVPTPTIPSLGYTPPTSAQFSQQYQTFLNQAAQDPDIVNYYQNLLTQAKGDTQLAIQFLQQDYTTGVRQTQDTLTANLKQLGLTSQQESQSLQDTLNKRGIALTQDNGNTSTSPLTYGGGGESASEVGQLQTSQQLRQEAEQRSASQSIENLGLTQQKGETSAGQQLAQYTQGLQNQQNTDIANRANTYMNIYQQGQQTDLQNKIIAQNQSILNKYGG